MIDSKKGIRLVFAYYARLCLLTGAGLLVLLLGLWLLRWLIDWNTPFDPSDWLIFLTGFIVVAVSLGPFALTVKQLSGVARVRADIKSGPPASQRYKRFVTIGLLLIGLVFAILLILSRSFMVWFTFGSLFCLMGLALYYITWQIGHIEKALSVTIYQTDYTWRFDKVNYVGVTKNAAKK
ncbi:MAG TPA: hypothetical protein VH186_15945 [Chloroflexia bacterium]|nr:hypothetical protein [Chloroflexia bacterium]